MGLFATPNLAFGAAGEAGEVVFAKGVATAQAKGGQVRFLGRGATLHSGDVITTASKSFAVLKLADDTRITLRPQTVFAVEELSLGSGASGADRAGGGRAGSGARALLRLFKGGLRAVTGFISKRDPNAFKLRTRVATIGIRGTQFEARICGADCGAEAKRRRGVDSAGTTPVAGRIVRLRGRVSGQGEFADPRRLGLGGAVYEGDLIKTAAASFAVVQYRDGTRTSIGQSATLRIDANRYVKGKPERSRSFFSLLRGGLRVVTGLIGRQNRKQFAVRTGIATIGIRGTGFDLHCSGECGRTADTLPLAAPVEPTDADCAGPDLPHSDADGLAGSVWEGEVGVSVPECTQALGRDQHFLVTGAGAKPTRLGSASPRVSAIDAPRPDGDDALDPSIGDPFAAVDHDAPREGLYVSVFEGDVTMTDAEGGRVDLGSDETGYAGGGAGGGGTGIVRVAIRPAFSPTPDPRVFDDPDIQDIFQLFDDPGERSQNRFECVL